MAASHLPALKRTPLYDRHVRAGARLVDFAGWEMPVQYDGVRQEHLRVREHAGIFDVSHMGQIATSGPQATALLQHLLSNDVSQMAIGGAQYSLLCREDGGVLDDLFTYRLDTDDYLTVTNASNHERDFATFRAGAEGFDAEVQDVAADYAMLAVQGPAAREIVQASSDRPLPARLTAGRRLLHAVDVLVCGTGYTGEDGVELLLAPADAPALWDELVRRGAAPAGLGARDTLRTEVCFPLYGQELTEERNPIEARLGWACKEDTGFVGCRGDPRRPFGGTRGEARRLHDRGRRHRPRRQPGHRRRRGDERDALAHPGDRHRHGLRARRARHPRRAPADRRPRPHARGGRPRRPARAQAGLGLDAPPAAGHRHATP